MYVIKPFVSRLLTLSAIVFFTGSPAFAAGATNTSALREAVTVDAVRDHQAAFQDIADANGGTRQAASPGADESAAYVTAQLEAAGYDVTMQGFDFPYFEVLSTPEFEQLAPTPTLYPHDDPAGFVTMTYSGSGDVTAPIQGVDVIIPPGASANTSTSGCEASDFAGFAAGNIALIQRGSCTFELKTFNAQNAGAAAVIIFNEGQPGRTGAFSATLLTPSASIPVITTSFDIGEDLYSASMGPGATARVFVDTISEVRTAYNVIADLPGHYDRVVIAGAHLDSVAEGPGINDNGSGSAALLEIALQMAAPRHKPRNTVRFAWWGAEEGGLAGSNFYVSNLSIDEIKKVNAYLELEMPGSPNFVRFVYDGDGSDFGTTGPEGSAMIEQMINDYFMDQGLAAEPTPLDLRHSYAPFWFAGIPLGGLFGGDFGIKTADQAATFGGTAGDQYDPCYHLACDTFDNVSLEALDQMSDAAAHAIQTLAMGSTSQGSTGSGRLTCEQMGYDFSIKAEPDGCRQSSGFWKSNPGAWPVDSIDIGGVTYSKADAIQIMNAKAKGDKTYSLFTETVAAKLNDMTCGPYPNIGLVIADADAWLALYPPGSRIRSKDPEWNDGAPINAVLSSFNGGAFTSGTWDLDGVASVEIVTTDGIYFDWTSTRSADAVIVKGGRNVNLYEYDPESFGDLGLHAPVNSKNDIPYGLSYVEFCYDWDIDISVRKFNDLNDNGVWDDGEPEIGVDQFLNPDGTIGGTSGWPYVFSFPMDTGFAGLFWTPGTHQHSFAGTYTIQEQEFLLWDPTALMINGVPQPISTQADIPYAGDADESVEVVFGNVGYAEILGKKFEDLNGNGVYDAGEPPVTGVEMTLDGIDILGNVVVAAILTDPAGEFAFLNLVPGTYSVTETDWPPGGWVPSNLTVSGPHVLDSGDSLDLGWVFGNLLPGSIHGYKFVDINGNGVEDDGEPGLQGVTIVLTGDVDGDGDLDQIDLPTNINGEYWFTGLWPGEYNVAEIVPDGWIAVTPTDVDVTVISGVELVAKDGQAMLTPEQIQAGYEEVIDERLVFGNLEPGSIHGYKFDDLDANGVDDGEPRVPGVTINLAGDVDGDGDVDQVSVVTDANGEYGFTSLYPGNYDVSEEAPSGWIPTTPISANVTVNSGEELVAIPGQAQLPPGSTKVEVAVGDVLVFGNFQLGSIHGYKFEDLDADGVRDDVEPRLGGWTFQLFDSDGALVDEQTTDSNGIYNFTGLGPDSYTVREVVRDGWTQSTPNPPDLFIQSGREYVAEDGLANLPSDSTKHEYVESLLAFGNFQTGSIHGFKFEDIDGDGVLDPAEEPRLEGRLFELLDANGGVTDTQVSDANGEFWFVELIPGAYSVREIVPDGWMASTENPVEIFVNSGQEYVAEDGQAHLPSDSTRYETRDERLAFGNFQFGSIHGLKFDDLDGDGVWDDTEPPLADFVFELIDADGNIVATTVTGPSGYYEFVGLAPGEYSVREEVRDGWTQSTANPPPLFVASGQEYVALDGLANLPPDSTKYETLEPRLAFGNFAAAEVSGGKFEDLDGNGSYEPGEPPVAGVEVTLDGIDGSGNPVILSVVTGVAGNFNFTNLVPGVYTITETPPVGTVPSTPVSSGPHNLQSGESLQLDWVFGNYRPAEISGGKFEDLNANGFYDPGEPGLAGIQVILDGTDGSGNPVNLNELTDANGMFYFTNLAPGQYSVTEIVPADMVPSTSISSGPHNLQSGEILPLDWVFGNYRPAEITGSKFEDLNANGIYDVGEPPILGIEIILQGTDGMGNAVNSNTFTDDTGTFHFNLVPGTYEVSEIVPVGLVPSTPTSSGPQPMQSGQVTVLGPVFGNYAPAEITGIKFEDLNQNGQLDPGELPVEGVIVTLTGTDGMGNAVNVPSVTDATGAFNFANLVPGTYTVTETLPPGWQATTSVSSGPHGLQSGESLDLGPVFGNYLDNRPPTAVDDDYGATGNVSISIAAPGVLDNDTDPDLPGDSLAATPGTMPTTQGGSVALAADGSFDYTPPAGYNGLDDFTYEVCDASSACDNGLVTITVADMIWFIDNSQGAGDGRLPSPFNTLAAFESSVLPGPGDCIFIDETGNGNYVGPLTLANGQVLVGKGSVTGIEVLCGITPAPGSDTLPATGGARPQITNLAGNGIVLASGNTVRGLNVGDTSGIGISGSGVGTASVSEVSILGNGAALGVSNGTLAMDFDSVSSTVTGNEGIFLASVQGFLEIAGGVISATNDSAVDISGSGPGLMLVATFTSLSSSGGSGPGINLVNTIAPGGFTVTGAGSAASGGTIQNMPVGVNLSNAADISLSFMQMNDFTDFGIRGATVNGFVLSDSIVDSATSNGNNAAADEGSVRFDNLIGTVSFAGSRIEDGYEDNIRINNNAGTLTMTVEDSTTPNNMVIGHNALATGNDGILLQTSGSAVAMLTVNGVDFLGARGDMIQTNALGNSDQTVTIENSTFNNTHPNIVSGGGGITLSGGSSTSNITVLYDVSANTFSGAKGNAITANFLSRAGSITGTIEDNGIGTLTAESGSAGGAGIAIGAEKQWTNPGDVGDLVHTVVIDNNVIQNVNGDAGIDILSNRGFDANNRAEINATIINNDISRMDGFALSALKLTVGGSAASGDYAYLCTDISGNSLDASDPVDGNFAGNAVYYDQISVDARHNIPGYAGSANGELGGGTASTDINTHLNADSNTLVNGSFPSYLGIGVDASTVLNVTNAVSGSGCL